MKKYKVYLSDTEWAKVDTLNMKEDKGWLKSDIVFMETMPYIELSNVRNEITWYLVSNDYVEEIERLNNIIEKIRDYVYKPIDKEWDDILCIIEDGLKGRNKE